MSGSDHQDTIIWKKFKNVIANYDDYLALNTWLPQKRKIEISGEVINLVPSLKDHRRQHWKMLSLRNKKQAEILGKNQPAWIRVNPTHSEYHDDGYRLCFGFKNTPCTYRGSDPLKIGCFNCGFYAGTDFKKASKDEILSQVRYAFRYGWSDKSKFDAIEILSDGSFLCDDEINSKIKIELFKNFGKMHYINRILVESTPEHIFSDNKEVLNLISLLNEKQVLEIGVGLETSDDFIRKVCINKGFSSFDFEKALSYLSTLPQDYKKRCKVVAYLLVKPAFLTPEEYINDIVNTIRYLAKIEKAYGISVIPKLEPAAISNGTILSLLSNDISSKFYYEPLNYWSILEIITRVEEEHELKDIFKRLRIGAREDMDEIIKVPAIYRKDGRYDKFDFILYNALQFFNQHHNLARVYSTLKKLYSHQLHKHKLLSPQSSLGEWYISHLQVDNSDSDLLGSNSYNKCAIERFFCNQATSINDEMVTDHIQIETDFLIETYKALDIIEGYSKTNIKCTLRSKIITVLKKNNYKIDEFNQRVELEEALSSCFEVYLKLFQIKMMSVSKEANGFTRLFFDLTDFISGKTYQIWSEFSEE